MKSSDMKLSQIELDCSKAEREGQLMAYAKELGVAFMGIAQAEMFVEAPSGFHPEDLLPGAKSVIVIGRPFLKATISTERVEPYTLVRNHLSRQMDQASIELCYKIETLYHEDAVPVGAVAPCSWDSNTGRSRGAISLKHAAQLAGLGRIGKNTLLIHPEFGNMVWLGGVVTTAEFHHHIRPLMREMCPEECRICIDACPVGALESQFDQRKCWDWAFKNTNTEEFRIVCRSCRSSCPQAHGKRSDNQ